MVWDCVSFVRREVHHTVALPNYSVLLDDVTRSERDSLMSSLRRQAQRAKLSESWVTRVTKRIGISAEAPAFWPATSNADRRTTNLLFSDEQTLLRRRIEDDPKLTRPATAVIVGGTGYIGKFIAEECRRKKMDVTVIARDEQKARAIFEPIFDGTIERRRRESMGYVLRSDSGGSVSGVISGHGPRRLHSDPPRLNIVHADVTHHDDETCEKLQKAVHHASVCFYLATAKNQRWSSSSQLHAVDLDGMKRFCKLCEVEGTHLVILSPLMAWQQKMWPSYLWFNALANKFGYLKFARRRERELISDDGSPGPLAKDLPQLQFSILRCNHIVFPAFQDRTLVVKNNLIADPGSFVSVAKVSGSGIFSGGSDLCARAFSSLLVRLLCFHRGATNSRIDVAGQLDSVHNFGVPLSASVGDLDAELQSVRHEKCDT